MNIDRFTFRSAAHLLLIKDNKVLLLRRFNTGWQDGNYSLVAGHLDGGEKIVDAMTREAKEEAGIIIEPENLDIVHVSHRLAKDTEERIDWFLTAHHWQGEIKNCEPHKCDDLGWFPLDDLPQNTIPYIRSAIHHYKHKVPFSEFGW